MNDHRTNTPLTPAVLRRVERKAGAFLRELERNPGGDGSNQHVSHAETKAPSDYAATLEDAGIARPTAQAGTRLALSALTTLALVGIGLAAVEGARIALVYEALLGFFGDTAGAAASGVLPLAAVLTLGLAALDAGLLVRLFLPSTAGRNDSWATWAAVAAWLIATSANTWLVMLALTNMMQAASLADGNSSELLSNVIPAAVAIVMLLLRLLLVGALAWDRKAVLSG